MKNKLIIVLLISFATLVLIVNLQSNQGFQEEEDKSEKNQLNIYNLLEQYKGFCVNGKDPSQLTESQRLIEFTKGPCQPVVLIPGMAATSLQLEIDCEVLQLEEPEIFKSCGWSTCSDNYLYGSPAPEYNVWIDDISAPDSIFQFSSRSQCLGNLMTLRYNESASFELNQKWVEPRGLRLTWKGNTKLTKNTSECGKQAIENFSKSDILNYESCELQSFSDMIGLLETMGYQSGITFQAIPYDFRKAMKYSNTREVIIQSLEQLNNFTGKRSFIVTHSYGSLHALSALQKMEQKTKDKLVFGFINIGAPFLGGFETLNYLISGEKGFLYSDMMVGIQYVSQQLMSKSMSSLLDLYPKPAFERFKDAPWMKEIMRRVQYEEGAIFDKTPLDLFPDRGQQCNEGQFPRPANCTTGLFDAYNSTIVQIADKNYTLSQDSLHKLLKQETINIEDPLTKYLESQEEGLRDLVNPGVPTIIVYGAYAETGSKFIYNNDPKEYAKQQLFYFPDMVEHRLGDHSVLALSAITPGIKWNYEFQNKEQGAKPVKFFEMCSNYNQTFNIFDTDEKGEKKILNSSYNGLDCTCLRSQDAPACKHSCIINDPYIIKFVVTSLGANETSKYVTDGQIPKWNDQMLKQYVYDCPILSQA